MTNDHPTIEAGESGWAAVSSKTLARTYMTAVKTTFEYWKVEFDLADQLDRLLFLSESERRELLQELRGEKPEEGHPATRQALYKEALLDELRAMNLVQKRFLVELNSAAAHLFHAGGLSIADARAVMIFGGGLLEGDLGRRLMIDWESFESVIGAERDAPNTVAER